MQINILLFSAAMLLCIPLFFNNTFKIPMNNLTKILPFLSRRGSKESEKSSENDISELIKSFNKITSRFEKEIKELEFSNSHMKRVLSEVALTMTFPQDTDDMMDAIINIAIKALDAEKGLLVIKNKNGSELIIKSAVGYNEELIRKARIKAGQGIIGWVIENGKPIILPEGDIDNRFNKLSHLEMGNRSTLCVPLIHSRKILGAININNKVFGKRFCNDDIIILNNLAVQTAVALENIMLREDIDNTYLETISALAIAVESRDKYTKGHSSRVSKIAKTIAKRMGSSKQELADIENAALLHDIGKIGIMDRILNKGKLTEHEFDIIKRHPEIGENIIKPVGSLTQLCAIVRHHHERFDGKGYPDSLSKDEIPKAARILAVADAFDAMTSNRPYRKALSFGKAISELNRNAGQQFDREVVRCFMECLNESNNLRERVH